MIIYQNNMWQHSNGYTTFFLRTAKWVFRFFQLSSCRLILQTHDSVNWEVDLRKLSAHETVLSSIKFYNRSIGGRVIITWVVEEKIVNLVLKCFHVFMKFLLMKSKHVLYLLLWGKSLSLTLFVEPDATTYLNSN